MATRGTLAERTVALAGVFQAATLAQQSARQGMVEAGELETTLGSLFVTDPGKALDVFGDLHGLRCGLRTLTRQLGKSTAERDSEITRYAVSLLHLERRLAKRPAMLELIADGLQEAGRQQEHFGLTHETVLAALAGIYSDTVSQIPPRIMVAGEPRFLSNPATANRIRAVLLAGIRAAVLWSQLGGSRWQILLQRKALARTARALLAEF